VDLSTWCLGGPQYLVSWLVELATIIQKMAIKILRTVNQSFKDSVNGQSKPAAQILNQPHKALILPLNPKPDPNTNPLEQRWCGGRADEGSRESVDAKCRQRTASWVRERAGRDPSAELCDWYETLERAGEDAVLEPGVYTLQVPLLPPAEPPTWQTQIV
jgi:hypothetical protein